MRELLSGRYLKAVDRRSSQFSLGGAGDGFVLKFPADVDEVITTAGDATKESMDSRGKRVKPAIVSA